MRIIAKFEDGSDVFYSSIKLPFTPLVGDTITLKGVSARVLRREFEIDDGDQQQWIMVLVCKKP